MVNLNEPDPSGHSERIGRMELDGLLTPSQATQLRDSLRSGDGTDAAVSVHPRWPAGAWLWPPIEACSTDYDNQARSHARQSAEWCPSPSLRFGKRTDVGRKSPARGIDGCRR